MKRIKMERHHYRGQELTKLAENWLINLSANFARLKYSLIPDNECLPRVGLSDCPSVCL